MRKKTNNTRKGLQTAVAVCAAILAIAVGTVIALEVSRGKDPADPPTLSTEDLGLQETGAPGVTAPEQTTPTAETVPTEQTDCTQPRPTETTAPQATAPGQPEQQEPEPTTGRVPQQSQQLTLPYAIADQGLTLERAAPYSGPYLEDGSDEHISNVGMILVRNTTEKTVEYAQITLTYAGGSVSFYVSSLPAGKAAIVQAQDRKAIPSGALLSCSAVSAMGEGMDRMEDRVLITENDDGSLRIENLTQEDMPTLRIFYKHYMEDEDLYVGGITYTVKLDGLPAGETVIVRPSHYVAGACRILRVSVYNEAG